MQEFRLLFELLIGCASTQMQYTFAYVDNNNKNSHPEGIKQVHKTCMSNIQCHFIYPGD